MAVPKQHRSKSRQGQRRMHIFIQSPVVNTCPKCGKAALPHVICQNCGYYGGREFINVLEKLDKKEKKQREKEMHAKEKSSAGETSEDKPLTMEELSKQ